MQIITQGKSNSIADIYNRSTLKLVMDAYTEFGEGSPELKEAQLIHQQQTAKQEAEYQARKAANQAWLYEQGY